MAVNQRISIPAQINGKDVVLALDTGAEGLVLFQPAAERLGLKIIPPDPNLQAPPGRVVVASAEPCDFIIANLKGRASFPVIPVPSYIKEDMAGIIGWANLRDNVLEINAATLRVRGLERAPDLSDGWMKFPLAPGASKLGFLAPMEDSSPVVVMVDTGTDRGASIAPKSWQEWSKAHPDAPVTLDAYFMPGVGLQIREEMWAKEWTLGPLSFSGLPLQEANATEMDGAGSGNFAAVIGLSALRQMDFVVDGRGGAVYMRPKAENAAVYPHNRLGAVFTPRNEQSNDLVATVAPRSPAAEAGIHSGDVLLKIDELDVTRWKTDPSVLPLARFWMRPAGTSLKLTLRRDGNEMPVNVTLRDILASPITSTP